MVYIINYSLHFSLTFYYNSISIISFTTSLYNRKIIIDVFIRISAKNDVNNHDNICHCVNNDISKCHLCK